jgi:lysophospholipase L1-like esterase
VPRKTRFARSFLVNATVGASVIGAVVIAECGLRLLGLAPHGGVVTVTDREFTAVLGLLAPNQDLTDWRKPKLPHHVHINGLGYRGPEIRIQKAPNETRILMAGDSLTFGDFVNDEDTLPAQLERELSLCCREVRVINAGVGDTTINDQSRMIERALLLKPDAVVLVSTENDLENLARDESTWDQLAADRKANSRLPLSLFYPVLKHMAVWRLALEAQATFQRKMDLKAEARLSSADVSPDRLRAVGLSEVSRYKHLLVDLRDRLKAVGVPLLFVLYPSHLSFRDGGSAEQLDWLTQVGSQACVPTINLLGAFRESGLSIERLYLVPHDEHPSARGHAVAARAVATELRRSLSTRAWTPDAVKAARACAR